MPLFRGKYGNRGCGGTSKIVPFCISFTYCPLSLLFVKTKHCKAKKTAGNWLDNISLRKVRWAKARASFELRRFKTCVDLELS